MDAFDLPDVEEDIEVPLGCDLNWGFQLEPWSGTGTTAVFVLPTTGGTSFPMVLTTTLTADDSITMFQVHLTPAQLATLGLNVSGATSTYVVLWTDTLGGVWRLGHGTVWVPLP